MVEQQVFKSYKLLSNFQAININDARWEDNVVYGECHT